MSHQSLRHLRQTWVILALALVWVLTVLTYGQVLKFPFLFDDLIHLRWLEGRSPWEVWIKAKGMQHYRPLVFFLWSLSLKVFGRNPVPLHILSLLLHVANALLVALLVRRLTSSVAASLAAAALFVTYPFSYQVLPSPGSQSKPVSTMLLLLACLFYWRGRASGRWKVLLGGLFCAMLAPFAYESAVAAGGLFVLLEYLLWRRQETPRFSPWVWGSLGVGLPYLIIWRLVPNSCAPLTFHGWEALWQNSVYFLQGLAWPIALLGRRLMFLLHLSDLGAVAYLSGGGLILLALSFLLRKEGLTLLFALGWWGCTLVVPWLVLPFQYVIDGPRLLYVPSVGVAVLWGVFLGDVGRRGVLRMLRPFALVVCALLVAWGAYFAAQRMTMCTKLLEPLEQAARLAAEAPKEGALLFVNVPHWFAPPREEFALGHEGYTVMPTYYAISLKDFVAVNRGVQRQIVVGAWPDVRRSWWLRLGYAGPLDTASSLAEKIHRAEQCWLLSYRERNLFFRLVGERKNEREASPRAIFADSVVLEDVSLHPAGGKIVLDLTWRMLQPLRAPYTVFVHLYDPQGRLIAQADGFPLGGLYPFSQWRKGEVYIDYREISSSPQEALRCTLAVGLYRTDNGSRAPAEDAQGLPLPDQAWREKVWQVWVD